jgi:hypothetical protein
MCVKYETTKTAKAIPQDIIHHTPTKEVIYRKKHLMLHTTKGAKMYQRNPVTAFLLTCDLKHSLQFKLPCSKADSFHSCLKLTLLTKIERALMSS